MVRTYSCSDKKIFSNLEYVAITITILLFVTTCTVGEWFCSSVCEVASGHQTDHVRNYSLAVAWYGLLDLCHRDVIREADGLAMMAMWRVNMLRFWQGHHPKYLATGHRLLAGG